MASNSSNFSHILPTIGKEGAINKRAVLFEDDFTDVSVSVTAVTAKWLDTVIDAGTGTSVYTINNEPNGVMKITSAINDLDGSNLQANGASFKIAVDKRLIFKARFKLADADGTDIFVGLAAVDPTVTVGVTDYIGFFLNTVTAADGILRYGVCKNGSAAIQGSKTAASTTQDGETDGTTGVALVDDTFVDVAIEVQPAGASNLKAKFFVNGAYIATLNAIKDSSGNYQDFPDDVGLTPTLAFANDAAGAHTFEVDSVIVAGDRQ